MKTDKRTNRINLHLNNAEMELFKKKTEHYKQMSAMIRDAVKQFDDWGARQLLDALNDLPLMFRGYDAELAHNSRAYTFYFATEIVPSLF